MQITDVRLRKVVTEGRMKAIASITIDHEFVVHDIRVIDGNTGLFVAMPSKRTPDGEFRDIAHPITSSTRQMIQDAVLEVYYQDGADAMIKVKAPEEVVAMAE
nr:septation regulator SpoVG [Bacilli bacterium]